MWLCAPASLPSNARYFANSSSIGDYIREKVAINRSRAEEVGDHIRCAGWLGLGCHIVVLKLWPSHASKLATAMPVICLVGGASAALRRRPLTTVAPRCRHPLLRPQVGVLADLSPVAHAALHLQLKLTQTRADVPKCAGLSSSICRR